MNTPDIPYVIAIPSYRRPMIFMKRTFALCVRLKIPLEKIHIFVVDEDYETYKELLKYYECVKIIKGPVGLHHMRNFITRYFPENTPILSMDDDIKDIMELKDFEKYKLESMIPNDVHQWIQDAFLRTRQENAILFGIYPVKNGYFMKDSARITTKLTFCVGVMWGIWNSHDIIISIEEKEDLERTLLCYERDNKVVRYNWIVPVTTYYKTPGGMQSRNNNRIEDSKKSCEYLINRWGQWCKLYTSKKSGVHEIRFRR